MAPSAAATAAAGAQATASAAPQPTGAGTAATATANAAHQHAARVGFTVARSAAEATGGSATTDWLPRAARAAGAPPDTLATATVISHGVRDDAGRASGATGSATGAGGHATGPAPHEWLRRWRLGAGVGRAATSAGGASLLGGFSVAHRILRGSSAWWTGPGRLTRVQRSGGGGTGPGGASGPVLAAALFTRARDAAAAPGAVAVARQLLAEGGAAAFFKGVQARVAVHTPSMAISWGTYELIKGALVRFTDSPPPPPPPGTAASAAVIA